jgi:Ca2+-binding RTX toxin-like protein
VTVYGGSGVETVNVGDDANSLSGLQGLLNVQNVTTLNLNDQGASSNYDYVLTSNTIGRVGLPAVSFSGTSLVNVNAGSGSNRLNVQGMPASGQIAFHGGLGADTVESTQFLGNTWNITSADAGNLNNLVAFDGVENLRGGLAEDTYRFSNGATLSGSLGDNGGTDTLDYSQYQTNVRVHLGWGLATGIGNSANFRVFGIENVTGGLGNDILMGNDANNILRGGKGNDVLLGYGGTDQLFGDTGRDILIGGTGADILNGGPGEDLLIGGSTSWDQNLNALSQLMSEWSRLDRGYAERAMNIWYGGGLTGGYRLDASTVIDDLSADQLLGGAKEADWFFHGKDDTYDQEAGEWIS